SIEVICKHKDRKTPCLDYHIGQCSAPCTGARTPEQYYEESIQGVIDFLKGEEEPVKKLLKERMLQAAADKKFETAAQLRNHLQALERKDQSVELVSDTSGEDSDIIGTALLAGRAHVVILHRRGGKMIGEKSFALSGNPESEEEVISQFIAQFYDDDADIPPVIVAGTDIPERDVLEELLKTRRGYGVKIIIPERGKKSHLLMLAEKNAAEKARQAEAKWEADKRNTETALEELKDMLQLPALPVRIEGYDISHLGGTETVGSMVVMRNGKAANDQYRSFTIRTLRKGDIDDYWSLKEVLSRRLRRLSASIPEEEKQWEAQGVTFGKAKKAEQGLLEGIQSGHPEELTDDAGSYEDYTVARANGDIVAMAKLTEHSPLFMELTLVWVAEPWQGTRLGQFLIRKILKTVKKGKVYTAINPALENVYAELGFRYVIKPSRLMQEKLDKRQEAQPTASPLIVMMWEAVQNRIDPSFTARPDLIVIDGGKGQLSAVWDVLQNMQLMIPVIGLAKREEEVFVPGRSEPIVFAKDSPAKFLLMRLRDEAHRSANRHREGRGFKTMKASLLDEVPGIGDTTRNELMKKFKTISGIRAASDEDLKEFLSDSQLELLRVKLAEDAARNG
ncbi:MAG: excinuclease subunit, partial [Candidatus Peribacteria bacterium]|nr:excinuclease subunit [Candidatus Peribacteria bacterium]